MKLEDLRKEWESYNHQLEELLSIQKTQLKTDLANRAKRLSNRLFCQEFFVCILSSIVIITVSAHYKLYLADTRYLVSFVLFLLTMVLYLGHEIFLLSLWLKRFNLEENFVSNIRAIELYKKHEKIQSLASIVIAMPILTACFPPLVMLMFNKGNFYDHVNDLLPLLLLVLAISATIGFIFHRHNKKTLSDIQRNLEELGN